MTKSTLPTLICGGNRLPGEQEEEISAKKCRRQSVKRQSSLDNEFMKALSVSRA